MGAKRGNSGARNLRPPLPGQRGAGGSGAGRQKGTKNKLTRQRVEEEIRRVALMDVGDLFERTHGKRRTFTLREVASMPPDIRACIASVKVRTENLTAGDNKQDQTVEIRLWNKVQALELCAKHFGWIKDKDSASEWDVLDKMLDLFKEQHREDDGRR
jgi:hypothetical protein